MPAVSYFSSETSGALLCRGRIRTLKTWPSDVLMAGGKGRAPNKQKQSLPSTGAHGFEALWTAGI